MSKILPDPKVLWEAFDLYSEEYCKTLPSDEELSHITFSDEFEARMRKLIARQKKFYYYWLNTAGKRAAAVIIALLVGLTTMTFSVKALREPFLKFIVETFEKFSNIIFLDDDGNDSTAAGFEFNAIEPQYIPEGYTIESKVEDIVRFQTVYVNVDDASAIIYLQLVNDESVLQADTENITYEKILINGYEGVFYSNKGTNTVVFYTEDYVFNVSAPIDKAELIKIAESIGI